MDAKSDDLKQEVVEVAQTLAAAAQAAGGTDVLAVDPKTLTHEVVKEEVAEARFAPVEIDLGSEPDWDADERAEGSSPTVAEKEEENKEPAPGAGPEPVPEGQESQGTSKENAAASASVKYEEPKEEELETKDATQECRPKRLLLGTAKVQLLSLVAEADAHNWERLTDRLRTVQGSRDEKAELVERLEELAEARSNSRKGLLESAARKSSKNVTLLGPPLARP